MTIPAAGGAGKWRRVSRSHPCPVCGHHDWCSLSADGALAKCMRVADRAWRTKKDKNGGEYYLHRLGGAVAASVPPPIPPGGTIPDRAEPDTLHAIYSALLAALPLARRHREALQRRGLSDDDIDRRGYGTLPRQGRAALARDLREQRGDAVLRVPGIITRPGRDGRPYVTIAGATGLLVPVRDPAGHVVALLVRRDDTGDGGGKYLYLSSARHGGPSPGTPPHFPLGFPAAPETVRLTEGSLKADLAQALSGMPTVGAAGLAWRPALQALQALGCRAVRLAFDADALDNPHVARALADCAGGAAGAGLAVELERWELADGKGIDDLLTNGKAPALLTGDDALAAIHEALTTATAGEPAPPPPILERIRQALDTGGAESVYRDAGLLRDLARLAEDDPGEYACCRATLARGGVRLRDLDKALVPHRQALRRDRPPPDAAECYRVAGGRIVRVVLTQDGAVEVPLTNWAGRIVEEVLRDDGAERQLLLAIEGALADGTPLPRAEVPAADFTWMRWPVERWGTRAVVFAGQGTADRVRAALQLLSGDVPRRTVYGHTGWLEVGGAWHYLHAGGAIGAAGLADDVPVSLPDPLAGFGLPAPPEGAGLTAALRASLALLGELAPARIMFPLLGTVYRAALGEAPGAPDLSLFLAGPHGAGKSELAALCQQHYGPALDARHLPGSWLSTGNALESLAFAAKDALLAVDDYAPRGAPGHRQRLEAEADRLLRAQGNRAGRGRCRTDGTVRSPRPPRGLVLSTGEDVPAGQSLRGRMLVLDVAPGDVPLAALTPYQRDAAAGLYAQALAGFVGWLAPQYGELCRRLPCERAALRDRALAETAAGSPRTPGIVADLALGLQLLLAFAREAAAITDGERADLWRRGWDALGEAAARHARDVQAAEPAGHFLRLLAAALASGRAHLAGPDGREPGAPDAWGWRREDTSHGPAWRAQGRRVGWLDGGQLYLEPEASYAAAQELARDQGEGLPVSPRTLWRRLRERGHLASWDEARQRSTVRRRLEGHERREVIHLRQDAISPCTGPSPPSPGGAPPQPECGAAGDGPGDGCAGGSPYRPQDRPQISPAGATESGPGDGGDGRLREERVVGPENGAPHRRHRGVL